MYSVHDVFRAFGGKRRVATICGLTPQAVRAWQMRGVAVRHWQALIKAAKLLDVSGITPAALHETRQDAEEKHQQWLKQQRDKTDSS